MERRPEPGGGRVAAFSIDALAPRLPAAPLTRFAPSPTGYLHLGHVANAVFVWGVARALGGRVLFRIEDHDRGRCRPAYESAMLDDLEWLGLEPDVGLPSTFRGQRSPYRQSDSDEVYGDALRALSVAHSVYACGCSRRDIAEVSGDVFNAETRYPGRCRERALADAPGRGLRVVLDDGNECFVDAWRGDQRQSPAEQCGDLLLRDRLGRWTYQFAVVVDDARHAVDLVIRGDDLLASTGRQIRLARMLGRARPPVFLHHPLIRHRSGAKLSKASGDTGIRELRAAGVPAEAVLGEAACRVGLLGRPRTIRARDLAGLFAKR